MPLASCILMIRPAAFGFNAETAKNNFFQNNTSEISQENLQFLAVTEFDKMVDTLRENNIEVLVVEDTIDPIKPDAIFPNNWLNTSPNGTLNVFPMFAANRRIEKREDIITQLQHHFVVHHFKEWSEYENEGKFLEGTGSMIIDYENKFIYACRSDRTHPAVLEKFAANNGFKAFAFTATDENNHEIYHTNVMMCLGNTFAVVCEDSIKNDDEFIALTHLLKHTNKEIIPISFHQMKNFAGNMLQVKTTTNESRLIMSQSAFNSLSKLQVQLLEKHSTLLPINVSLIEHIEGGSVRCMMAEIFLEKK